MTFGFSPQPSEEIHIAPLESYEQFKLPSDHSLSYVNANLRVILQQLASVLGNELEHGTNLFVQGTAKWLLQLVHLWYFQSESPKWLIRNKERSIQFRGWDWLAIVSEMHNSHLMLEVVIRSLVNIFFLVSQKAKLYFVRAFRTRNKQQADYKVIHQVIVSITTNFDQLAESALYPHWTKNPLFMLLWAIEDDMRSLHITSPTQAIHIVDFFGIKLNEGLAQKKRNLIRLATLGLFIMLDPAMLGFEWIWDLVIASNTSQYRTIIGTALLLHGNIISRENIVNFRTIFFEEIRALEEIGCADQLMRTLTFSDNLLLQH